MSILNRLNLLIRSNINDAVSGRSPSAREALREMEISLRDAKRQQIELRASEKRLVAQVRQAREEAEQWENRAMMALRRGEEDLAREALVVKNKKSRQAERIREQLDEHRAYMADISRALEALEVKLEGTRGRIQHLSQRTGTKAKPYDERSWDDEFQRRVNARSTEATKSTSGPIDELENPFIQNEPFQEFDRMSGRIDSMEAEIDAMRELALDDDILDPRRADLEKIFRRMESQRASRDDLSDLKKKFE